MGADDGLVTDLPAVEGREEIIGSGGDALGGRISGGDAAATMLRGHAATEFRDGEVLGAEDLGGFSLCILREMKSAK